MKLSRYLLFMERWNDNVDIKVLRIVFLPVIIAADAVF